MPPPILPATLLNLALILAFAAHQTNAFAIVFLHLAASAILRIGFENPGPDYHGQEHVQCIVRADGLVRKSCNGDTIVESCFQHYKTFRQVPCRLHLVLVLLELQFVLDSELVVEVLKGDSKASVWVPYERHVISSAVLI